MSDCSATQKKPVLLFPLALAGLFLVGLGVGAWWLYRPSYWRGRANQAIRQKNPGEALLLLQRVLQSQPGDTSSRLTLAQLLEATGNIEEAVLHAGQLPPSQIDGEAALTNLGRMLIAADRPTRAEEYLHRCLRLHPRTIRARQLLLDICRWQHREEESLVYRSELLQLTNDRSLTDRAWILVRSFTEEYTQVEDQENWNHLLRCQRADPNDPVIRVALARHLIHVGDRVEDAANDLRMLLPRLAENVSALSALATYWLEVKGQSFDQVETLLNQWPEKYRHHTFWRLSAMLNEHRQNHEAAEQQYRKALSFRVDDLSALNRLAVLLRRTGARTNDASRLQEARTLADQMRGIQATRARSLRLFDSLQAWFERMKQAQTTGKPFSESELAGELATFYRELGRTDEAESWSRVQEEVASAAAAR